MRRSSLPLAAPALTVRALRVSALRVSALRVSALRVAALTVSALALTACLDDPARSEGVPPPADASPDAAVDRGPARCDAPYPARGHCEVDADCPAEHVCRVDPERCVPSFCECTADGWLCTTDCSLGPFCVPVPQPCGDDACTIDERCVEGRCLVAGDTCARDFDCPDGYCHPDHRLCFEPCVSEPSPALAPLDPFVPECGVGEATVWRDGNLRCVDARTCEVVPPDPCVGAILADDGACRTRDGEARAPACCTLARYSVLAGYIVGACAPAGGPALELGFGPDRHACGAGERTMLRVVIWQAELPLFTLLDVTADAFPGMVERCDADGCEPPTAGELYFNVSDGGERPLGAAGRFWFEFAGGDSVAAEFSASSCRIPPPMCQ